MMYSSVTKLLAAGLLAFTTLLAHAGDVPAEVKATITGQLKQAMPDFEIQSIATSEVDGLYEVALLNGPVLLSTPDGKYLVSGAVFSTASGQLVNLTEAKNLRIARQQIDTFYADGDLVVFSPKTETKRWIAVFTDSKCGYCRKFHNEIPQLNAMGIEVRYLAYPAYGGEESRVKMLSAWCSDDPNASLTRLKSDQSIPVMSCAKEQVFQAQASLGRRLGFRGTPGMMFDDGTVVPGYRPPEVLKEMLGI